MGNATCIRCNLEKPDERLYHFHSVEQFTETTKQERMNLLFMEKLYNYYHDPFSCEQPKIICNECLINLLIEKELLEL